MDISILSEFRIMSDNLSNLLVFGPDNNMIKEEVTPKFDFDNINISFNGCGFLGVYHVGVACALKYYLPNMKFKNICGASAGAMAAACLIANVPLGKFFN